MLKLFRFVVLLFWLAPVVPAYAAGGICGGETPCKLENGEYYVLTPDNLNGRKPNGAIFYLHGHGGKALNAIRNPAFKTLADDLGIVFVAVQGVKGDWSFPTAPDHERDEYAFFGEVMTDLEKRYDVDPERTMLSGFSSGAFMTWYTACYAGKLFAGYAPISGAFWQPLPDKCPSPAPYLFHVHGRTDKVVPLEGRALGGGRWHQGDVYKSFQVWLRQLGVDQSSAVGYEDGNLSCERWTPKDGVLELCLHDGGHSVRAEWIRRAWHELSRVRTHKFDENGASTGPERQGECRKAGFVPG